MRANGVIFLLLLTCGAFSTLFVLLPVLLLLPIHSSVLIRFRRSYVSFVVGYFFCYATFLTSHICGTKILVYCNTPAILNDRGALLIANHRTRVDWMFAGWCYASVLRSTGDLIILLKDSMKSIPIYGWAMQVIMFIFLGRKRETDVSHISTTLTYLLKSGRRPCVFLFPEGTDLSPSNVTKSNDYAKANQLPETSQVLYPKPTGLMTCLSILRGRSLALHDITIAYKDFHSGIRTSEVAVFKGESPSEVHLFVDRFDLDDIPSERSVLDKWLKERFLAKDAFLNDFYSKGTVPSTAPPLLDISKQLLESDGKAMVMVALNVVIFGLSIYMPAIWWVSAALAFLCVSVTSLAGGFDKLELALHSK